jgi:hypothetical protein
MIRRLRAASGAGRTSEKAEAALERGLAHVLVMLDNVIDDDSALERIYAAHRTTTPGAPPHVRGRTPEPATTAADASGPPSSRRRVAVHSLAGVAIAVAVAGVVIATVGVPGSGDDHTEGPAVNTAYVVKRVDRALSAAAPGEIAQMTVTTRAADGTTTAQEWSYGDRWRAVIDSPSGRPVYDEGFSSGSVYTVVSYQARTWARRHESGRPAPALGPRGCAPAIAALPLFPSGLPVIDGNVGLVPAAVARDLRAAISCGALAVAGRQRVDGIEAIELTSGPGSPIPETIWVSPGSYLPVRVTVRPVPGVPGPWQTANITWQPATAQLLASLTVSIPAGFRQVPIGPILSRIGAGSAQKTEGPP